MEDKFKILILEDEALDAELMLRELSKSEIKIEAKQVETREAFIESLELFDPDIILSDHGLPQFDGISAMEITRERKPDTPFIFVSGVIGEEKAIELLRSGATDYVLKNRLQRLLPAVERALSEAGEHRERKRAQQALRISEERFSLAVQGANDGIWDWDLDKDKIYFSPRWKMMIGYDEKEIVDNPKEWLERIHAMDIDQFHSDLNKHLDGYTTHFQNEHRIRHRNSSYIWVLCRGLAVRDEQGMPTRMAGSLTDITQRKRNEEQLIHDAFHDALTGLPNRALFFDRLDRTLEHGKRHEESRFAVLYIDIDDFKLVNDSLGHLKGDELLKAVAERLEACIYPGDTLARLGGDEYAILLEEIDNISDAIRIAEQIKNTLALPLKLQDQPVFITASIGITVSSDRYSKAQELLRDADTAMYRAKAKGKGEHVLFDSEMHVQARKRLELESELRQAMDKHEFQAYYQPIISLDDSGINGFEALMRWNNPRKGLVMPNEFITILEETGLINQLGNWILQNACSQATSWNKKAIRNQKLSMSVNLSPKQFLQSNIVRQISDVLNKTGLDPRDLKLEITENMIMADRASAIRTLQELKKLGVLILMDDFGTGYSSLSYLHQFPIDILKVDRSFVSNMNLSTENMEIVKTIILLAKNLGIKVIAEGIETEKQLASLKNMQCEFGQGYLFSKPTDAKNAEKLLKSKSKKIG